MCPLPVAVSALHFLIGPVMVETAFVALWQASCILLHRCSGSRYYRGMNSHDLLLLVKVLYRVSILLVLKLLLVVTGF